MKVTKYVLPVVVGAMIGMILIILGEMWIHHMYPLPPGTDMYDAASLAKGMKDLPEKAFGFMMINYVVCSFLAGVISTLIAGRTTMRPALVIGIVLTLAGVYNVINLPHPGWFTISNLLVYIPFSCLGYLVVRKKVVNSVP